MRISRAVFPPALRKIESSFLFISDNVGRDECTRPPYREPNLLLTLNDENREAK